MFALFLIAFLTLAFAAAAGVLADSGLRWWSAFGLLRRQLKCEGETAELPTLRPVAVPGGGAAFFRNPDPARCASVRRAA